MANLASIVPLISAGLVTAAASAGGVCGEWNTVPTPNPGSGNRGIGGGVAALAANDVWALGRSGAGVFTIRWDGSGWSEVPIPNLSEGFGFDLDTLDLVGGQLWMAGVIATSNFSSLQVFLTWDGSEWDPLDTLELVPQSVWPFAPRNGAPRAMDGVSADDIWIVGSASGMGDGVNGNLPLTVHWDGSGLTEHLPPTVGNRQNHLYGVAAVASNDVWAVGYHNNNDTPFFAQILHWDGTDWSNVNQPALTMVQTFLYDVVALGPDDVWAVGEQPGGALFMHFDGAEWTIAESPTNVTTRVHKIAAIAPDDIWAVGAFSGFFHWDGSSWSALGAPEVPGADSVNRAGGLAAAGVCDAWSVGGYTAGGWNFTFAERLQPGPVPTGDLDGDGTVGILDFLLLLGAWGPCPQPCPPSCTADFDEDCQVGVTDFLILLANWG